MQRAVNAEREVMPTGGNSLPSAQAEQATGQFVINLCASTTPMALGQASHPALKRYKFFISRRREEGRERFRMHLGFFASQAEAEALLEVVREFYPAAWAGVAPGQKLRAAAAAAAAMDAVAAATPVTDDATASMPALAPAGLDYAPEAAVELSLVNDGIERSLPPQSLLELEAPLPLASSSAAPDPEDDRDTSEAMNSVRAAISSLEDTAVRAPTINPIPVLSTDGSTSDSGSMPGLSDSQVLRVLEAPGKNAPTLGAAPQGAARGAEKLAAPAASMGAAMGKAAPQVTAKPVPPVIPGPVAKSSPVASPAAPHAPAAPARSALPAPVANAAAPVARAPAQQPAAPSRIAAAPIPVPSQAQAPRPPAPAPVAPASAGHASSATVAMPGLAQVSNRPTSAATPEAAAAAAAAMGPGTPQAQAAAYAVQLVWSVQPIDMASVPQLAIFAAYTLYAAEGNRDGRRWFGLRLGFFTDPVSARQVAQYVRSEFKSVSVVPVTARETERAAKMPRPAPAPAANAPAAPVDPGAIDGAAATAKSNEEFRLLETGSRPKLPDPKTVSGKAAPGKRAKARMPPPKSSDTEKNLKKRRAPLTLEETLEILGAGELQVAENRVELLSDSGVRHLSQQAMKAPKGKESRFSRLMDRLSERK